MGTRPTICDVACEAGVAASIVSRAYARPGRVNSETAGAPWWFVALASGDLDDAVGRVLGRLGIDDREVHATAAALAHVLDR
jgi:hypothetical protein